MQTFSERSSLVEDEAIRAVGHFERRSTLDADSVLGSDTGSHHDSSRCGEAKSAWASDN